ncbi:MAG: FAD-dependent oxidoreductase [Deltaproteobacteria bacterium]|nr:FAD-dependent oxidoreductase [Deltaproteobacteria bacterium]
MTLIRSRTNITFLGVALFAGASGCGDGVAAAVCAGACVAGEVCVDGRCVAACARDEDCAGANSCSGARCEDKVCVAGQDVSLCLPADGCCPAGCDAALDSDCGASCATVTACLASDGCCPAGCTATEDDDCVPECGNGVTEPGETCDGDCPPSCADLDLCTADTAAGTPGTCDLICSHAPRACGGSDGCCPAVCDGFDDSDCPPPASYEVIVAGAGTGGFGAAVQAARMGRRVAVLEETDLVGGQAFAAGVSTMDESSVGERSYGIYKELVDALRAQYATRGKSIGTCYWSDQTTCFEPKAGRELMLALMSTAGSGSGGALDLYLRARVTGVVKSGTRVIGVRTADGRAFASRVVIDATEYGDLLPLAGADYRVANSTSTAVDLDACIQDITYVAIVKKYPGGAPPSLVLSPKPPGYDDEAPYFARIVTAGGYPWWNGGYPVGFVNHNAYRGLPDSSSPLDATAGSAATAANITKTGVNFANDYPAHAAYNPPSSNPRLAGRYLEDPAYRRQVNCAAKLRTLQFIYYMQTALNEPLWSVADDEGFDTPYNREEGSCADIPEAFRAVERHFPPFPYVRESRRLIGLHTLSAPEVRATGSPALPAVQFPSAIGVAGYGIDLHNCHEPADLEAAFEAPGGPANVPFQIPFESFIPPVIDGFLPAEKNFSQTRLVNGATRLQPSTMLIGQGVGALAAVAVARDVEPRAVPVIRVQDVLVRAGARLSAYYFTDVLPGDPFWPSVEIVSTHGIMVGYGNWLFGRDDPMTRGTAAVVLARLFSLSLDPPAVATFTDVPVTHPLFAWIEAVAVAGITAGCSASPPQFCPDTEVTRAQYAVFVARGLGLDTGSVSPVPVFSDVGSGHWAFPFIQAVYEAGLMVGCSGPPPAFCPDAVVTRGQAAAVGHGVLLYGT